MDLPNDLRLALERELRAIPAAELARTAADLSARYRAEAAHGPFVRTEREAGAYAALRMPATFAAIAAALVAAQQRLPGFAPRSLLDIGAGTGATLWAAGVHAPSLTNATLIEAEAAMIAFGQRLARHGPADVPYFDVDDRPYHEPHATRQFERGAIDDRGIGQAL